MIKYPTVLVLGAGASYPYGLPLGYQLRNSICTNQFHTDIRGDYGRNHVDSFVEAFNNSHINSIDSFLARRSEYVEIGKAVIASIISNAENPDRIHKHDNEDDIYKHLWNRMIEGVFRLEDLEKNNIRIITFNYDRSLEFFLYTSIVNTFGADSNTAYTFLKKIPIIHFYGSLGNLGYNSGELPYRSNHQAPHIYTAAKNIKVMHEDRDVSVTSKAIIDDWFIDARNIIFLGFGFDDLNITRLALKDTLEDNFAGSVFNKRIIASTYGLTKSEVNIAREKLIGKTLKDSWKYTGSESTDTLRMFAELLL